MNDSFWNWTSQTGRGSCSHKPSRVDGVRVRCDEDDVRSDSPIITGPDRLHIRELDFHPARIWRSFIADRQPVPAALRPGSAAPAPRVEEKVDYRSRLDVSLCCLSPSFSWRVCVDSALDSSPWSASRASSMSLIRGEELSVLSDISALFTSNSHLKLLITVKVILYLICCTLFNCQSCSKVSVYLERLSIFSPFLRETPVFTFECLKTLWAHYIDSICQLTT